jgi:hypothetical protein
MLRANAPHAQHGAIALLVRDRFLRRRFWCLRDLRPRNYVQNSTTSR